MIVLFRKYNFSINNIKSFSLAIQLASLAKR